MHFSKIEAATVPSLFDVYTDCSSMIGPKPGPRQAVDSEIFAYAAWLSHKAGFLPRDAREIVGCGYRRGQRGLSPCKGVTYGKKGDWNNEALAYGYEPGSFSVPFPGRNAHRDMVTMETLDDDGNVIASQTLPVEPKKGGVIWDRDAVRKAAGKVAKPSRGKVAAPLSAEIDDKDENPVTETQEPVAVADDAREVVALPSGPEITPAEPVSNRDELPAPGLADQVAALAAMVEEMRGQLAALSTGTAESTTPIEGMTTKPPVSGKRVRTAAHERAIRRAWANRRQARLQRAIAEDHMAMREKMRLALRASEQSNDAEYKAWKAEKAALVAQIDVLKAKPHHMGQEIKPDDYQRLIRERDEARASLASDQEKLRVMRANLERGTDALDMMTERALRAENALRAVEQRQARADSPYRVNVGQVNFRAAA